MENTQIFLEYMIPHMIDALHKEGGLIDHIIDEVIASKGLDRQAIKDKICTATNPYMIGVVARKNEDKKKRVYNKKQKAEPEPAHEIPAQPAPEPAPKIPAQPAPEPAHEIPAQPAPQPAPKIPAQPAPEPAPKIPAQPAPEPAPKIPAQPAPEPAPKIPDIDGLIPLSMGRHMQAPKKRKNEEEAPDVSKGKEIMKNIRKGIANQKKAKKAEKEFESVKSRINMAHLRSKSVVTKDIKDAAKLLGFDTRMKAEKLLVEIEKVMNNDFELPNDLLNLKRHELQKYAKWIDANYENTNADIIKALEEYKTKNADPMPEPEQEPEEEINFMNLPEDEEDWNDPDEDQDDDIIGYEDYDN